MPWHRFYLCRFWSRRLSFESRSVPVGFVVKELITEHEFLQALLFSIVGCRSTKTPHSSQFTYRWRYIIYKKCQRYLLLQFFSTPGMWKGLLSGVDTRRHPFPSPYNYFPNYSQIFIRRIQNATFGQKNRIKYEITHNKC